MLRLWVAPALVTGVIVASVISAPVPKEKPATPIYFPTEVGTEWKYEFDNGNSEQVLPISSIEEKDGAKFISRQERGTTAWIPADRVAVTDRGLMQAGIRQFSIEPYYLLKFPIKAGDTWDYEFAFQVGLNGSSGTFTVLGEEEVKVPASTFKAVKVELVAKTENGKPLDKPFKSTTGYAPEVGRVKVVNNRGICMELKTFTRPKK